MPQTILITGAAQGIGRDAAFALAKRGHRVIATTHNEEQSSVLRGEVNAKGFADRIVVRKLDITLSADIVDGVPADIDVLINNAAHGETGPIAEIPFERVQKLLSVNVMGTLAITQRAVKLMMAREGGGAARFRGRIVIVSSIAGRIVVPYLGPYSMTKFALEAMGDALRNELRSFGISVSLIEPGRIYTGFNERMAATKYEWLSPASMFWSRVEAMKRSDAALPSVSSPTTSVVRAIVKSVESSRPRARYTRPLVYAFFLRLYMIARGIMG